MDAFSFNLVLAAAGLAFLHTVLGPDHTLPFVMLMRARHWSMAKTLTVTIICGVGHVASSLLLGLLGLALGFGLTRVEAAESVRGSLAAWALVVFGAAYALWGVRQALRHRFAVLPHEHQGHVHVHSHADHSHDHNTPDRSQTTFWALFVVFVLGPCEPLIPLFVLPASRGRWDVALLAAIVFSIITVATMAMLVGLASLGMKKLPLGGLERWSHALAGAVIALSGLAVIFLGL